MIRQFCSVLRAAIACAALVIVSTNAHALTGYGVNSAGNLFKFDVDNPNASATSIGPVGFVPEGIDFKPGTNSLYAVDITAITIKLYTINISTGTATPVGAGFAPISASYNLTGNQHFGFDFNPTSTQADTSMRIRLVGTNGDNLRLNSLTGALANEDPDILIQPGNNSPFVDASAYSNNLAGAATTTLHDMDTRNQKLYTQDTATGALTQVGPFGFTNAQVGVGFDIATDPSSLANRGLAVLKRPDAPLGGPLGAYLIYDVNLATGSVALGALVGPVATVVDFDGGFSVLSVPEPATLSLLAICAMVPFAQRRRRA